MSGETNARLGWAVTFSTYNDAGNPAEHGWVHYCIKDNHGKIAGYGRVMLSETKLIMSLIKSTDAASCPF
jgi:hypothetical protein